jgi:hypothetical protein
MACDGHIDRQTSACFRFLANALRDADFSSAWASGILWIGIAIHQYIYGYGSSTVYCIILALHSVALIWHRSTPGYVVNVGAAYNSDQIAHQ